MRAGDAALAAVRRTALAWCRPKPCGTPAGAAWGAVPRLLRHAAPRSAPWRPAGARQRTRPTKSTASWPLSVSRQGAWGSRWKYCQGWGAGARSAQSQAALARLAAAGAAPAAELRARSQRLAGSRAVAHAPLPVPRAWPGLALLCCCRQHTAPQHLQPTYLVDNVEALAAARLRCAPVPKQEGVPAVVVPAAARARGDGWSGRTVGQQFCR